MSGVIAIVSAAIAAASAALTVWLTGLLTRRAALFTRELEVGDRARLYREPLLQSAFSLQSRLFNIVRNQFLDNLLVNGSDTEKEYAVFNTLYVVGEYLCWNEILRQESQYLNPSEPEHDRRLTQSLEKIRDVFSSSRIQPRALRVFRGQQRAIGEVLLAEHSRTDLSKPRFGCMGYAEFIEKQTEPSFSRWFAIMKRDLEGLHSGPEDRMERLVRLQHALIDLINSLDPDGSRVPLKQRQRA